jgi:hypothetical protein
MIELIHVFIIVAGVYIVARTVSLAELASKEAAKERQEKLRKKKIAELYGR